MGAAQARRLPASLEHVEPSWLTAALQAAWPGVVVTGAVVDGVTHGTATGCRVSLRYADRAAGPPTLWMKAGCEPHSPYLFSTGTYLTEVSFYDELVDRVPVGMPRCYFAAFDARAPQFVLLLEDLGARPVAWAVAGRVGPERARVTLDALARLHGKWWGSPALDGFGWLQSTSAGGVAEHYRRRDASALRQALRRPRADMVGPKLRDPERLASAYRALLERGDVASACLVHGDAHAGNVYFGGDGTPGFVDWQGAKRACWAWDVAQFLVSALGVDERREHERALLESYLDRLAACVGARLDFDTAWREYRRHVVYPLIGWLCTNGYQPEAVCAANVERFAAAAVDLDALSP